MNEYVTVEALADLLHCSIERARQMSRRRELPSYRVGGKLLFRREDVGRYVQDRLVGANAVPLGGEVDA